MSVGPVLLFDKSTLQSLSVDESVWFDQFFFANITPLFFVEILADIEKEVAGGRTPEQVVGNLAEKTPTGGFPNVSHGTLCFNELLGVRVEMRGRVITEGGKQFVDGARRGIVMEQSPEVEALNRWRDGQFLVVERAFAKAWREALSTIDLEAVHREGRTIIERLHRPRDLAEAKAMAATLLAKPGSRYTRDGLAAFGWPPQARQRVLDQWYRLGEPPLSAVAPFTAHVLTVDHFFTLALGADLIGRERPTNKVDIAYLYYLPFCNVFTSRDSLHRRTAPLFMTEKQEFVWGDDLKVDLARMDAHFNALPDEVKERGVMEFAHYPPTEGDFLVAKLWDKVMRPEWRDRSRRPAEPMSPEEEKQLIAQLDRMAEAAKRPGPAETFGSDKADAVMIQHQVPVRKGKWRLLPPEVEAQTHAQP